MNWKTIKSSVLAQEWIFKLVNVKFSYENYKGETVEVDRVVFDRGNSVGMFVYDENTNETIVVEQFRPGPAFANENPFIIEIPAGTVENGLPNMDTAIKELKEEINLEFEDIKEIKSVGNLYLSAGGASEKMEVFIVNADLSKINNLDHGGLETENEDILIRKISIDELNEDNIKTMPLAYSFSKYKNIILEKNNTPSFNI